MMRRLTLGMSFLLAVSAVWAGIDPTYLPSSTHYQGRHSFFVNEGNGSILQGHLEFAVYDTQEQTLVGYEGQARYVYAYQVFNYASSTASLNYFALTGLNPAILGSTGIGSDNALGGQNSGGIEPTDEKLEETSQYGQAVWNFANGTLIKSQRSWFLLLYSNHDYVTGSFEVKSTFNDEPPIPNTPEPATMALLACGAIWSLRSKRLFKKN